MIDVALELFSEEMNKIDANYSFMQADRPTYPYSTGEYSEISFTAEDNKTEGELLVECWHRGTYSELLKLANKIKNHFKEFRAYKEDVGILITYQDLQSIRTGDIEIKKIQITLNILAWEGE
ncbi:MAG: hypothetical protein ACRCUS_06900 [Anaerovoracaceae bacterium]